MDHPYLSRKTYQSGLRAADGLLITVGTRCNANASKRRALEANVRANNGSRNACLLGILCSGLRTESVDWLTTITQDQYGIDCSGGTYCGCAHATLQDTSGAAGTAGGDGAGGSCYEGGESHDGQEESRHAEEHVERVTGVKGLDSWHGE